MSRGEIILAREEDVAGNALLLQSPGVAGAFAVVIVRSGVVDVVGGLADQAESRRRSAASRAALLLAARMRSASRSAPRLGGAQLSAVVVARSSAQGVLQPEHAADRAELQDGVGRRSGCEDVRQRVHGTSRSASLSEPW
jgi:hypothetical protein